MFRHVGEHAKSINVRWQKGYRKRSCVDDDVNPSRKILPCDFLYNFSLWLACLSRLKSYDISTIAVSLYSVTLELHIAHHKSYSRQSSCLAACSFQKEKKNCIFFYHLLHVVALPTGLDLSSSSSNEIHIYQLISSLPSIDCEALTILALLGKFSRHILPDSPTELLAHMRSGPGKEMNRTLGKRRDPVVCRYLICSSYAKWRNVTWPSTIDNSDTCPNHGIVAFYICNVQFYGL